MLYLKPTKRQFDKEDTMKKLMLFITVAGVAVLWVDPVNAEDAAGRGAGEHFTGKEQVVALPGGSQMTFVWIEPGTFQMGLLPSEEDERLKQLVKQLAEGEYNQGEEPVHEVETSTGFWLGKYVVTQGQWEAMMGTTPWRDADDADKEMVQSNPSHPAVYISWHDVQALIQRLNSAAGEEVYRLPTEAEWEYACRAGTSTLWSFGDEESAFPHYAWYRDNTVNRNEKYAHAVGQHRPNAWGLHDMHGNVWEWVQDWYNIDYYKRSPRVDPLGPISGSDRVIRGGDFSDPVMNYRSASRMRGAPDTRDWYIGVRLLKVR